MVKKFRYSFCILKCWQIEFTGNITKLFIIFTLDKLKSLIIIIFSDFSEMKGTLFHCSIILYSSLLKLNLKICIDIFKKKI